jgi:hypothetical protein
MIKKYHTLIILLLTAALFACNGEKKKVPVNDVEVANYFIRNLLDNNFNEAELYLLKDETNNQLFDRFKNQFSHHDKATLDKYKNADIIVTNTSNPADSIFIYTYINSYKTADTTTLKLVRTENKWLVDLKYTFPGN